MLAGGEHICDRWPPPSGSSLSTATDGPDILACAGRCESRAAAEPILAFESTG